MEKFVLVQFKCKIPDSIQILCIYFNFVARDIMSFKK